MIICPIEKLELSNFGHTNTYTSTTTKFCWLRHGQNWGCDSGATTHNFYPYLRLETVFGAVKYPQT